MRAHSLYAAIPRAGNHGDRNAYRAPEPAPESGWVAVAFTRLRCKYARGA